MAGIQKACMCQQTFLLFIPINAFDSMYHLHWLKYRFPQSQ